MTRAATRAAASRAIALAVKVADIEVVNAARAANR